MTLEVESLGLLKEALQVLEESFDGLPLYESHAEIERLRPVLLDVATRMKDNLPYPHPFYLGQMIQPPHPMARLAYMLSLWINPNNHALEGGRASSGLEREAVAEIATMVGWTKHLGHLCGGGTLANLEALWISHRLNPQGRVLASRQAHFTHERLCTEVLKIPFSKLDCDEHGRMSLCALEDELERGGVGTVVVTLGTTSEGMVDPLKEILELRDRYHFRVHVDAAYGGYFVLSRNLSPYVSESFQALSEVDSLVIDPHKCGLQPYGCGCVLFKDPGVGRFYKHDSPYTFFDTHQHHLGEITLECSRAGSSAVALWATQKLLPLVVGGEFAATLESTRRAALDLYHRVEKSNLFKSFFEPDLDIVVWAPIGESAHDVSCRSQEIFERCAARGLHLAITHCPRSLIASHWPELSWGSEVDLLCLRSCMMKPEHERWMDRIWPVLENVAAGVVSLNPVAN